MDKDKALRLALKHGGCPPDCKDGRTDSGCVHPWCEAILIPCPNCKTITACQQALANDALDRMSENERELGIQMQPEPPCKTGSQCTSKCEGCAEPEPVAWMDEFGNTFPLGAQRGPKYLNEPMKPLYTSPPKRKPLTDGQLEKGLAQTFSINNPFCPCDSKTFRKVARWVEAAHGIKE